MIVMILGEEVHTWLQSFKLNEKECKIANIVYDFAKSMGIVSAYWIHQDETLSDVQQNPVRL